MPKSDHTSAVATNGQEAVAEKKAGPFSAKAGPCGCNVYSRDQAPAEVCPPVAGVHSANAAPENAPSFQLQGGHCLRQAEPDTKDLLSNKTRLPSCRAGISSISATQHPHEACVLPCNFKMSGRLLCAALHNRGTFPAKTSVCTGPGATDGHSQSCTQEALLNRQEDSSSN